MITPEEDAMLAEIFHKYHTDLYLYVNSHIQDSHAVEDIVAETFALACEKIDEFKNHPNQKGWLIRTAHNKTLEMYRRLKCSDLCYDENEADSYPDDCSQYRAKELELVIESTLTPNERRHFLRYFIWGWSISELAAIEGTTVGNISVRLTRIRRKLAGKLKDSRPAQ